jgi:hypothetical protein
LSRRLGWPAAVAARGRRPPRSSTQHKVERADSYTDVIADWEMEVTR